MVGLVELFSFTKVLEDNFLAVMRGILIEYGSQNKGTKDVLLSMGWTNPRKQRVQEVNNGRPPDTTETLIKKVKLGRPNNSVNIDGNPHSTYPSYKASNDPSLCNRCWMAAGMETQYVLYRPLWLQGTTGQGKKDLFTNLIRHFSARATYKLTGKGQIQSVLRKGQSSLFNLASKLHQGRFIRGKFSSCNYFIEVLLKSSQQSNKIANLFTVNEERVWTCPRKPKEHTERQPNRPRAVIEIQRPFLSSITSQWGISPVCSKCGRKQVSKLQQAWCVILAPKKTPRMIDCKMEKSQTALAPTALWS
jgi:hypothetical protein